MGLVLVMFLGILGLLGAIAMLRGREPFSIHYTIAAFIVAVFVAFAAMAISAEAEEL